MNNFNQSAQINPESKSGYEQFQTKMSLPDRDEMIEMKLEGRSDEEIWRHFRAKERARNEETAKFMVEAWKEERKRLNEMNRAARRREKEEEAMELARSILGRRSCPKTIDSPKPIHNSVS